jgi:hypothetical protein
MSLRNYLPSTNEDATFATKKQVNYNPQACDSVKKNKGKGTRVSRGENKNNGRKGTRKHERKGLN